MTMSNQFIKDNIHASLVKDIPAYIKPFSSDVFAALVSGEIALKDYKVALPQIEKRFAYVFFAAMSLLGREVEWFDYENAVGDGEGSFDIDSYADEIIFEGSFKKMKNFNDIEYLYKDRIPTKWLLEDFEQDLVDEIKSARHLEKANNLSDKSKSKLSP